MFRSGYIAIVGRPNVGKSTLLNLLVGQKIAAVTEKPQTTRHRILGIRTLPEGQFLFIDTLGIHRPHKNLNDYMMQVTQAALEDVDLFLFLIEPTPSEKLGSGKYINVLGGFRHGSFSHRKSFLDNRYNVSLTYTGGI